MALRNFASRLWRLAPAVLLMAVVAGCDNTPPPPEKFPELSFTQYPPIKLNVARVEVVKEFVPSDQPPHIETLTPRTLIDSTDRWARDRLRPVGDSGFARFIITDASLVEVPLKVEKGLAYSFTNQQSKRYDAHVAVRLEIHNARGFTDGEVTAAAANSRSVAQDISERERSETWYLIVERAMLDLNAELDRNISAHLTRFMVP